MRDVAERGGRQPAGHPSAGAVDEISERYLSGWAELDPVGAAALTLPVPGDRLTDWSPDGHRARADLARRALAEVEAAEARDASGRLSAAVLRERLTVALELGDAHLTPSVLNTVSSPVQEIRLAFTTMPTATADHWAAIARRLAGVGPALDGLAASLLAAARHGVVAARRQVLLVAGQCDWWSGRTPTGLSAFDSFATGAWTVRGADGARVVAAAVDAADAFGRFAEFLRARLLPLAPAADGVGADAHRLWSRSCLGADVDPREAYGWGLSELERVVAELRATVPCARAGGSLAATVDALDSDPRYRVAATADLLAWVRHETAAAIDALRGAQFDIGPEMERVEARTTVDGSGPAAYYTPPAADLSAPGTLWWAPPGRTGTPVWRTLSQVHHEGVPGHHLQAVTALAQGRRLNRFRRQACEVPGYAEGWAMYAERLVDELGLLPDDGYRFGALYGRALRVARVVIDIGLHLRLPAPAGVGTPFWTAGSAVAFLREQIALGADEAAREVDRCLGWPAQATSYALGERVWLAAREDARRRAGNRFDPRRFHGRALALGQVGLDLLRQQCRAVEEIR